MTVPDFRNFTGAELAASAGGDPWKLNDEVQSGKPGAISDLADAFHIASGCVAGVEDDFQLAKKKFQEGWRHNDNEHPINDSAEVARVTKGLKLQRTQLAEIAASLMEVAASLANTQLRSDADVGFLNMALLQIDEAITAAKADSQSPQTTHLLHDKAVSTTKASLRDVQTIRETYIAAMKSAETAMQAQGYVPDVIDPIDGEPQNAAANEAALYGLMQRRKDEGIVRAAGIDSPEGQAAAARLRDYNAITNPATSAESQRLAGERLNDHRMANFVGPLPKDAVTGQDARPRAQNRLENQRLLEQYGAKIGKPVSADQVTKRLDASESLVETQILDRARAELERTGMTPEGATRFVEGVKRGEFPKEYVEALQAGGNALDGGKGAISTFAEKQSTNGRHWIPGEAYSPRDVDALKNIAKHIGLAGSVTTLGTGIYEWQHGVPLAEVGAKAGGAAAGAWLFGEMGALGGGAVGGPPGAFAGALIFGTVGAFLGEEGAEKAYASLMGK